MSIAYIDISALVAIESNEPGADELNEILKQFESIISSHLLEAEYRSVCAQRGRNPSTHLLSQIDWVNPNRRLTDELNHILEVGYLRGADLWHVAVALYSRNATNAAPGFHLSHLTRNN